PCTRRRRPRLASFGVLVPNRIVLDRLFASLQPPEGKWQGNVCPACKPGARGTLRRLKTPRFPAPHARHAPATPLLHRKVGFAKDRGKTNSRCDALKRCPPWRTVPCRYAII